MKWMRRIESWWWARQHPEFDEPDTTTPEVIAAWVASHKHPAECRVGCQCSPTRSPTCTGHGRSSP